MGWDGIPADVFQAILLRIPLSPRRRLRLVCRHWRNVIDERTPLEPRARAKVLVFFTQDDGSGAFVIDGLPGGRSMEMALPGNKSFFADGNMIGTCNGLLCLWGHDRCRRRIAVINPVTHEMVTVDLPSASSSRNSEDTYSFGYHPATGQYKILRVQCDDHSSKLPMELNAVHVFTLGGDRSWREVPAPAGSSCDIRFGFVTIDGVTYWAEADAENIMSFDLKNDRMNRFACPPMPVAARTEPDLWREHHHLTDVRGRLGLAVSRRMHQVYETKGEVWVLEGGRDDGWKKWVKRFTVVAHKNIANQEIALPHVIHGEHVLTTCDQWGGIQQSITLSAQLPREEGKSRPCLMLRVGTPTSENVVASVDASIIQTFAYVETREPLLVYR